LIATVPCAAAGSNLNLKLAESMGGAVIRVELDHDWDHGKGNLHAEKNLRLPLRITDHDSWITIGRGRCAFLF
jgi:hypothetical protein